MLAYLARHPTEVESFSVRLLPQLQDRPTCQAHQQTRYCQNPSTHEVVLLYCCDQDCLDPLLCPQRDEPEHTVVCAAHAELIRPWHACMAVIAKGTKPRRLG